MNRLFTAALAAALATSGFGALPALAKDHGNGNGHGHGASQVHQHGRLVKSVYRNGRRGYTYESIWYPIGQGPYPTGNFPYPNNGYPYPNNGYGEQSGPHGCVNPAGHVRGWCKHGATGAYYGNNGGNGYGNQQVSGIVTAISGTRITILMGLRALNIDARQAYNNGRVSGVGIGSTITAYGYYGNNNTFFATSIT